MSGLADELLADLDGLSDDGGDYNEEENNENDAGPSTDAVRKRKAEGSGDEMSEDEAGETEDKQGVEGMVLAGGIRPAEELDAEDVQAMDLGGIEDVGKIAKLQGSKKMLDIIKVSRAFELKSSLTTFSLPGY